MAPWADPIQTFFEGFKGFVYDPEATPAALFDELAKEQGWAPGSGEHREALERLNGALYRQFDPSYGTPERMMDSEELTPAEWAFILHDYEIPTQRDEEVVNLSIGRQPPETSPQERTLRHLDAFFADFPGFERDRSESVAIQLNKLRKKEKWWGDRIHLWNDALRKYQDALVQDFNAAYGSDENNLENWHRLFSRIPDAKWPDTIDGCKSVARTFNVNLVDLVDADAQDSKALLFDSRSALSSYTKKTKKFFPSQHASAGGLLTYLL
ncbi:hypothetical protein AGABI2DRAFT_117481 [Agaricus bisporus var. bisporus H97]|uniref:hypothetical protein n=1 Tax=Agaricus bisporus var. bisporus (strain H97 / ATCC MYA-4626 / FGSC 10389) TaxID=936046 RepID=UPI00029F547B|nr:hypothetical protein AGABI2DRAFT_117481 [Agaricus bisporus var. bisporus H97]EKV48678.1 hypothetical protein AGABI2DRAFT_117481 [Agaricus bisporus var. bisporus H97]